MELLEDPTNKYMFSSQKRVLKKTKQTSFEAWSAMASMYTVVARNRQGQISISLEKEIPMPRAAQHFKKNRLPMSRMYICTKVIWVLC